MINREMQVKKRTEGKIKIDKGIHDGFLFYKSQVKDLDDKFKISRTLYGKIIKELHENISHQLLYESSYFRMPCGLPTIRIKKYKRKPKFRDDGTIEPGSLAVNWKKTRELWENNPKAKELKKLVYFINDHTDGYSATFTMEKHSCNIKNLSPYRFKTSRTNDRLLSSILLNPYNKIDYFT